MEPQISLGKEIMMQSRESTSNEIVSFNQLYGVLNGMRDEYNGQMVDLRNEGRQAVLAERANTDQRILEVQARSQQEINAVRQQHNHECAQLREENQRLREEMGYVQADAVFTKGQVIVLNITNGLKKIKDERKSEQHHLGCRVAQLSFTIGICASGVVASAAATPFLPEAGIPLISITGGLVVGVAPFLHKFDVEWRAIKNMPTAEQQQKEKEEMMFPGMILTPEMKKQAYDAVVADEGVRSAASKESLREAEQEAEKLIAQNSNTITQIGNLMQAVNNANSNQDLINNDPR